MMLPELPGPITLRILIPILGSTLPALTEPFRGRSCAPGLGAIGTSWKVVITVLCGLFSACKTNEILPGFNSHHFKRLCICRSGRGMEFHCFVRCRSDWPFSLSNGNVGSCRSAFGEAGDG